jgi:homogentisate phytyltransferase/homogentisate geranylgeranyltransferase
MSQTLPPDSQTSSQTSPRDRLPLPVQKPIRMGYAFWKFSRPHTIIGTTLSVVGLWLIALSRAPDLLPWNLWIPGWALVACLCGNIYIVGLNQLEDVSIDQINKPHLPLASGEFTRQQGLWIVGTAGILAIALALWQGMFLAATVLISLAIGTAYSLPPLRLKRFPLLASLCIFTVRGVVVNLGLFLHFQQRFGGNWEIPIPVWALTLFVLVFTFAIAIFKDIPDLEGDRQYHITTFTVTLGSQAVFNLARWVITGCYLGMLLAVPLLQASVNPQVLIGSHTLALVLFWLLSLKVDLDNRKAIARFYQFIWALFFLEYLTFPLACLSF